MPLGKDALLGGYAQRHENFCEGRKRTRYAVFRKSLDFVNNRHEREMDLYTKNGRSFWGFFFGEGHNVNGV